jgi:hypothetical protein
LNYCSDIIGQSWLQVLSPLMRVSPAYGEVVMGVFALIAYQVHMLCNCSACCIRPVTQQTA